MSTVAENDALWREVRPTLTDLVKGKSVALVGNAESIQGTGNGPAIDACDVVIRINAGRDIAESERTDVGSRTDVLYCGNGIFRELNGTWKGPAALRCVSVPLMRWMRSRHYVSMIDGIACNPTTGTVLMMDLALSGAAAVYIFGMDFFLTGDRKTDQPRGRIRAPEGWPIYHDYEQDRLMVRRLLNWRPKLYHPDAVLAKVLTGYDNADNHHNSPEGQGKKFVAGAG